MFGIGEKVSVETGYGTVWSWKYKAFKKNPIQHLLWAFFGNDDQGCIPKKHHYKDWPQGWKGFWLWWIANPAHNWARYVIGFYRPPVCNFPDWEGIDKYDCLNWKPRKWDSFENGLWWVQWKHWIDHPTSIIRSRKWHPCLTGHWIIFGIYFGFYVGWRSDAAFAQRVKIKKED